MTNPKETLIFDGRKVILEWIESDSVPSDIKISQVTGYCVNDDGKIVKFRFYCSIIGQGIIELLMELVDKKQGAFRIYPDGPLACMEVSLPRKEIEPQI